jgi:hypothetical protein
VRGLRGSRLITAAAVTVALSAAVGCGGSAAGGASQQSTTAMAAVSSPGVLTSAEARRLLLQLPYRYSFRHVAPPSGASGAVAGRAVGAHHTLVHFGIALGHEPEPVPVPQSGTESPYSYPAGGFVFTDDLEVRGKNGNSRPAKQFHTWAQWDEATTMVVEMQEKLCKKATGEACPP